MHTHIKLSCGFLGILIFLIEQHCSIIYNNVGASLLIENKLDEAISNFNEGINNPGMNLHKIGIEVNRIIARRLTGENIPDDELCIIAENTLLGIDYRYDYQIANILLNLLKASKKNGVAWDHILNILHTNNYLNKSTVVNSHSTLMYQLANIGILSGNFAIDRGIRGKFIEKTGFIPIIHKTWI